MRMSRGTRWSEQLSQMSLSELDELIANATRRQRASARETELQRLRKELIGRIVSSGYSFEEIFAGTGRFPLQLVRQMLPTNSGNWSGSDGARMP